MGSAVSIAGRLHSAQLPPLSEDRVAQLQGQSAGGPLTAQDIHDVLTSWGASAGDIQSAVEQCPEGGCDAAQFSAAYSAVCDAAAARRQRLDSHARYRALSLPALLRFTAEHDLWATPTHEVVSRIISPATAAEATGRPGPTRMVDLLTSQDVGESSVFVSHGWANPFGLLVAACVDFSQWLAQNRLLPAEELFFWVDTHAIMQHRGAAQSGDLSQLEEVIHSSRYTLLVLDPSALPLRRAWCLYEISTTLMDNAGSVQESNKLQIRAGAVSPDTRRFTPCERTRIWDMFHGVDMSHAEATFPEDLAMINSRVEPLVLDGVQGFAAVNWLVQRSLIAMKFDTDSAIAAAGNAQATAGDGKVIEHPPLPCYTSVRAEYAASRKIGEGSYGYVYKATRRPKGSHSSGECEAQEVCMKRLPAALRDLSNARSVLREVNILSQLDHPNIVRLVDAFTVPLPERGHVDVLLCTELADTDLYRLLRSSADLSLEHIAWISYQMLQALDYIHSRGIIHRDIKPHNILMNGDCSLKLSDLGCVRRIQTDTSNQAPMTEYVVQRWYRPPELLLSGGYGTAVDIWAAGCVFAELHVRSPVFPGRDSIQQLDLITQTVGSFSPSDLDSISANAKARSFCEAKLAGRENNLRPALEKMSGRAVDDSLLVLLSAMLCKDPALRPSARELITPGRWSLFQPLDDEALFAADVKRVENLPPFLHLPQEVDDDDALRKQFRELLEAEVQRASALNSEAS